MAELLVVRHAQASFGSDNYDQLSELGLQQAELVGEALRRMDWVPDRMLTGSLWRQKQTLAGIGFDGPVEEHAGFDEYDFYDLLAVRFGGTMPEAVHKDRKTHFRALRETILEWQQGGLGAARESWATFEARVAAACRHATMGEARRVLVISSGGPIAQMVARAVHAPDAMMIDLNLQVRNTSLTRFVFSAARPESGLTLAEFNAVPHFQTPETAAMMSYS